MLTGCAPARLADDVRFELRRLQKCYYPDLTTEYWHALLDRWRDGSIDRVMGQTKITISTSLNGGNAPVNTITKLTCEPAR